MSPVCALYSGGFAGHLSRSWVIALNSDSAMCLGLGMDRPASPETFVRGLLLGRALEVLLFGEPVSLVSMGLWSLRRWGRCPGHRCIFRGV